MRPTIAHFTIASEVATRCSEQKNIRGSHSGLVQCSRSARVVEVTPGQRAAHHRSTTERMSLTSRFSSTRSSVHSTISNCCCAAWRRSVAGTMAK